MQTRQNFAFLRSLPVLFNISFCFIIVYWFTLCVGFVIVFLELIQYSLSQPDCRSARVVY
jgi:hypothetical protein